MQHKSGSIVKFETPRLRLRTWNEHYAKLLSEHCNNDEVMRYLGGKQSRYQELRDIEWLKSQQRDYGITFWALERKDTNEFIGFCGLTKVDDSRSKCLGLTEIGWRLRTDAQGQGFAFEAAVACIHCYFNALDGLQLVSRVDWQNEKSIALMRRLAMRRNFDLGYMKEHCYSLSGYRWAKVRRDFPNTAIPITPEKWNREYPKFHNFAGWKTRPDGAITIHVVFPSQEEAEKIGEAVIEDGSASRKTILGAVRHIHCWNDHIEVSDEVAALFETDPKSASRLIETIVSKHGDAQETIKILQIDHALPKR